MFIFNRIAALARARRRRRLSLAAASWDRAIERVNSKEALALRAELPLLRPRKSPKPAQTTAEAA